MDNRKIVFSGIICTLVGAGLGLVLFSLFKPPYQSHSYRNLGNVYIIAGAIGGALFGTSQEARRQLKQQQDEAEKAQQIQRTRRYRELESDASPRDRE